MQTAEQKAIYQMSLTPGMGFITGPEGQKAVRDVIQQDKECSHRLIVNIVGKERQGKTSLRKLLSNDLFDENEESTVGVDHELVDTVGLEPNPGRYWYKLDIHTANKDEYDSILGKHLMIRLSKLKYQTMKQLLAPVIVCARIGLITWITFAIYSRFIVSETLKGLPWFGILLCFMFTFLIPFLGIADGTGIGVGIRHYVMLIDAWFRWDLASWCLTQESPLRIGLSVLVVLILFLILEITESVALGQTLGIGLACAFCLCSPPSVYLYLESDPLTSLEVHLYILGCLIGLYLHGNSNYKLLSFLVVLMALLLQSPAYFITLVVSISVGALHNRGIKIGQNLYCILDHHLKKVFDSKKSRRLTRHAIGIVWGLLNARMFGWEFAPDFGKVLTVLTVVLLVELFSYLKSLQLSNKRTENKISQPSKVIGARTMSPRLKLLVRDFAGHPLYYTAHHLYMSGQCIYLLVFSLVEASQDFQQMFKDVLRWLRSIQLHSQYPQTRVFLVGTRRDDSRLCKEALDEVKHRLKASVPRMYHNVIVWNDDDSPLFPVENSSRYSGDRDHKNLKEKIIKQTTDIILQEKFPVKFFFFFVIIEHYRQKHVFSEYFHKVYRLCKEKKLMLATESEFEEMLVFFHKMGEIMYRHDDDELKKLIIFDPRNLLNIICHIITVPKMSERPPHLVSDWSVLEESGLCSDALFHYVFDQHSAPGIDMESAITALSRFHLICKLKNSFIIPSSLPETLPFPEKCWTVAQEDKVFYIKSLPHFPEEVFLHLLCACAEFDNSTTDGLPNMSRRRAIFTYNNQLCYQLELIDDDISGLLKIVLRTDVFDHTSVVLLMVWQCLCNITQQDFKRCSLTLGYLCPYDTPHEDGSKEKHLLVIADNKAVGSIPSKSQFWCCGRKVCVSSGQVFMKEHSEGTVKLRDNLSSPGLCTLEKSIMDLPHHIFQIICDHLNPPKPLGNDWTMLAGLLGFTVMQVEMIKYRNRDNPCSSLLQMWCSRRPDTRAADLLPLLEKMERYDVMEVLENADNLL